MRIFTMVVKKIDSSRAPDRTAKKIEEPIREALSAHYGGTIRTKCILKLVKSTLKKGGIILFLIFYVF